MRKEWTTFEINYLEENIGMYKLTTIAEKMNRSCDSIVMKINRLGLSNTKMQTGLITLGELAKHLKVDRNTVKGWVQNHGLPCTKKVTRTSKRYYLVAPSDFWKWAEMNKDKVQFSKITPYILLPEPEWVAEERKKDKDAKKGRKYRTWTTTEDQRLIELYKSGYSFKEISDKLNRSTYSVEHRYRRIKQNLNNYIQ